MLIPADSERFFPQNCTTPALAAFEAAFNASSYSPTVTPTSVEGYFASLQVSADKASSYISADARTTFMS